MASVADTKTATATAAATATGTHQRAYLPKLGDPLQILTEPIPKPTRPGSVIVRILASDVPPNYKELFGGKIPWKPPVPMTPGGSCVGVVEALADDVIRYDLAVGTYVVCNRLLKHGDAALLIGAFSLTPPHAAAAGAKQSELWKNGTWAQYATLPEKALFPIDSEIVKAVPLTVLVRSITLSIAHGAVVVNGKLQSGQTVLVGGATGVHGLASVLVALAGGASTVYVMGRTAAKLKPFTDISSRVKAVVTGSDEKSVKEAFAAVNNKVDLYVDFYPYLNEATLPMAGINSLKTGGIAVLGGGVQANLPLTYGQILIRQLTITGSLMYPDSTIPTILKLLGTNTIDWKHYTAAEYSGLDKWQTATEAAAAGKEDAFKAHVMLPNGK